MSIRTAMSDVGGYSAMESTAPYALKRGGIGWTAVRISMSTYLGHINVSGSTSIIRAVAPHLCSWAKRRTRCSNSLSAFRLAALIRN